MRLIVLHKLGTTWEISSIGKGDEVDTGGRVDVCIWFDVDIVDVCVDVSNSIDEVDPVEALFAILVVKSGDGWDNFNSVWEMIGTLWLKLLVLCRVDVYIGFGVDIVLGCVDVSNSIDEVDLIEVFDRVGVNSGDDSIDFNSVWKMIGSLSRNFQW